MRVRTLLIASALIVGLTFQTRAFAESNLDDASPRFVVHLLDYLAKDYSGAVGDDGHVIADSEYREQIEFSKKAEEMGRASPQLDAFPEIRDGLARLKSLIAAKAPPSQVSKLARDLQSQVTDGTHLEVSPKTWPNLEVGRHLFAENCAACHGPDGHGDGLAGKSLKPAPANFHNEDLSSVTPSGLFNTIRLGVPGTGMPAFSSFSDDETWSLAFFVVALRHGVPGVAVAASDIAFDDATLQKVATMSDESLRSTLPGSDSERRASVAALRLHSGDAASKGGLDRARSLLISSEVAYKAGDVEGAQSHALKAYLEGIEPVEARVRASDPDAVVELEGRMAAVRAAIDAGVPPETLVAVIDQAKKSIAVAEKLIEHKEVPPSVAFAASSAILLREGFEAVLMILALLGVIRATGSRRAALWVHGGWIAALCVGLGTWFLSGLLLKVSGAQREMMEALTSLFAVAVLLIVGFWLHSQTEIGRWNRFLRVKVQSAVRGKKLFGLALISFVAVFREAFETVLFMRALWVESGDEAKTAMLVGVVLTLVGIIVAAYAVLKFSTRLPVRKLFTVSAVVMAVLAFILTGKGLHSLQETGALGVTSTWAAMKMEILGLYPTWETFLPQIFVLFLVASLWVYGRRPSMRAAVAQQ